MVHSYEKAWESINQSGSVCGSICYGADGRSKSQGKKGKYKEQLWKDRTCGKRQKGTCIVLCPCEAEPLFV